MNKRRLKRRHYRYGIRQFWYGSVVNNYGPKRRYTKSEFIESFYKRSWPR